MKNKKCRFSLEIRQRRDECVGDSVAITPTLPERGSLLSIFGPAFHMVYHEYAYRTSAGASGGARRAAAPALLHSGLTSA
jgi:hypothetical protein